MRRWIVARGALVTAVLASVALLLAACVGLPTSGAVSTEKIDTTAGEANLVSLPELPQAGATPEQILQGFILAGRGPQDGYRVARAFLTDDFRAEWKPNAGVIISNSVIAPVPVDADTFNVTVSVLARVNASGNYTELASAETTDPPLTYDLEKNADGEWRISSAPDGTLLTETRFNNTFKPYELSFFDASGAYLVPDLRWFAVTPSTKDRIVTELLNGPSPWLGAGVLVSAFPTGTKQGDPVVIDDAGQATVDLSSEVRSQTGPAKQRMLQQLTASLSALADVRSVRITVGGLPLPVPEGGTQPQRVLTVDANPLGLADGSFGYLKGSSVTAIPGISNKVEALGPIAVSLGRDRDSAAVLSPLGASLVTASADPLTVDIRQGLVPPTLDVEGFLWSIPADGNGGLLAVGADGTGQAISMPLPVGARITSLEISRDGSRLLVAMQTPDGPQLLVWGIVRDTSFAPTGLGAEPLAIAVDEAPIIDATWVDQGSVAVLSQVDGSTAVDLYQLGGKASPLGTLPGGVGIAGGNLVDGLRVVDGSGVLFRPTGTRGWQATAVTVSLLATQQ